jgi:hypothetical protein
MSDHEFHDHIVWISPEFGERFKYESPEIQSAVSSIIAANINDIERLLTEQCIGTLLTKGDLQILIECKKNGLEYSVLTKEKMFVKK